MEKPFEIHMCTASAVSACVMIVLIAFIAGCVRGCDNQKERTIRRLEMFEKVCLASPENCSHVILSGKMSSEMID